jgi:hypothetical protein
MRSGIFTDSAIRKPQIAQVNFFEWTGKSRLGVDGKKSAAVRRVTTKEIMPVLF